MQTPLNPIGYYFRIMSEVLGSGRPESDAFELLSKLGCTEATFTDLLPRAKARRPTNLLPEAKLPVAMKFMRLSDFLQQKVRRLDPLLLSQSGKAVIGSPSITQLHAYRGVGKSNFTFALMSAIATGGEFLIWKAPRPRQVWYIEGEQPDADLQDAMKYFAASCDNFILSTLEMQPEFRYEKIVTPEGQAAIEEVLLREKVEVLNLDSISTLANVPMNEEQSSILISDWLIKLRGMGIAVFYQQHDGKTGQQRGHSKSEDWLNYSIQLTWQDGYQGADGLKFHLKWDKVRKPSDGTAPLSVSLLSTVDDLGAADRAVWSSSTATPLENKRADARRVIEEALTKNNALKNFELEELLECHVPKLSYKSRPMLAMFADVREKLGVEQPKPGRTKKERPVQGELIEESWRPGDSDDLEVMEEITWQ